MNTRVRNYEWLWPICYTIFWAFRMLCVGVSGGLITIWLDGETSLGRWSVVPAVCLTVAIYFGFAWIIDWLAFAFKIILSRLAGFRFVEFWFRWLFVKRKKGKLVIRKAKNYNKFGVCHMLPPKREGEKYPMFLYYFGGGIGLVCMAVIGLLTVFLSGEKATLWVAALLLFSVLALLGPIEFLVQKLTVDWEMFILWFQPWMKKVFRLMNQVTYSKSMGIWFQDMPEEWFAWEPEFSVANYYAEWHACYRFQYLFYSERYREAEQFAETVLEPKMKATRVKKCLAARVLYVKLLLSNDTESITEYYEKVKDILLETTDSEAYRSLYLYLKYVAKLPETAEKYRDLWEKALIGQEERDIIMEREQARQIDEKWGGTQ